MEAPAVVPRKRHAGFGWGKKGARMVKASSRGWRMRSSSCAEKASLSVIDALAGVTYSASR